MGFEWALSGLYVTILRAIMWLFFAHIKPGSRYFLFYFYRLISSGWALRRSKRSAVRGLPAMPGAASAASDPLMPFLLFYRVAEPVEGKRSVLLQLRDKIR